MGHIEFGDMEFNVGHKTYFKSTLKLEIEKMRKTPTDGLYLKFGYFSRISGSITEWLQNFDITRIDAIKEIEDIVKVKIKEYVPPALPPVTPPPSETEEVTVPMKPTDENVAKRTEDSLKEVPQKKLPDNKNKSKSKKKKNKSKKSKTEQKDLQVKSPKAEVTEPSKKPEEKSHIQIDQKIKIEKEVSVKNSVQNKDHGAEETEDIPITILKPKFPGGAELPERLQKFEGQLQPDSDMKLDSDKQVIIKKSLEKTEKASDSSSSSSSDSSANEKEVKSEGTIEGKKLKKQSKSKKTKKWERMMTKVIKPEEKLLEKSDPQIKEKTETVEKSEIGIQSKKETEVKIKKTMRKQSSSSSLPSVKMSSDEEILVYLDLFNDMKIAKEGFKACFFLIDPWAIQLVIV